MRNNVQTDNIKHNLLINEAQLGEQLNESVHSDRRADFSLMLAMLVGDVSQHSQFTLPKEEISESELTTQQLRKDFHLPEPAPLALKALIQLTTYNQADKITDAKLTEIQLQTALTPQALAFRDEANHIPHQVLSNTSLYCQNRHQAKVAGNDVDKVTRLAFNAKAWLDAVQTSLVKSPMMSVHSA